MSARGILAIAVLTLASALVARLPTQAQPAPLPSRAPDLDQVAGVYKHRFANSDISGDRYTSEDIFELVEITPRRPIFAFTASSTTAIAATCGAWRIWRRTR